MMKLNLLAAKMEEYLKLRPGEEAVHQPRYHYQSLAASAVTTLSFFGSTVASATGGIRDTNMTKAGGIETPKRFVLEAICADVIPGSNPSQYEASAPGWLNTFVNDIWKVCSVGALELKLIDTTVLTIAPILAAPAGRGIHVSGVGVGITFSSAADKSATIAYAANGVPTLQAARWLKVPFPLSQETSFSVVASWTTAPSLSAAARMGIILEGFEFRPAVAG